MPLTINRLSKVLTGYWQGPLGKIAACFEVYGSFLQSYYPTCKFKENIRTMYLITSTEGHLFFNLLLVNRLIILQNMQCSDIGISHILAYSRLHVYDMKC